MIVALMMLSLCNGPEAPIGEVEQCITYSYDEGWAKAKAERKELLCFYNQKPVQVSGCITCHEFHDDGPSCVVVFYPKWHLMQFGSHIIGGRPTVNQLREWLKLNGSE